MPVSKSKNKKGLGRTFESLIPTDLLDESFDPTASQDHQVSDLRQIRIDQITIDPDQPRKNFTDAELNELAVSIKEHGVLQPIIVSPHKNGYQIVAGERRFRASKLAGLEKIPALVRTLTNQHKLEVSLIENLQRQDLNVMETATAFLKLRSQFNMTLEEIGKRVGNCSIEAVSNKLRLLKLPNYIHDLLINNKVTEGQVRPLIGLSEDIIKEVIPKMMRENWSARKVEQFVVDLKNNSRTLKKPQKVQSVESIYKIQQDNFKKHLRADVTIQTTTKGYGKIVIKFKNEKEFKRLEKLLS